MFKILSLKEESSLNIDELLDYYEELRKYALNRKLSNTTFGALSIAPKLKKLIDWGIRKVIKLYTGGKAGFSVDGTENIPQGAVIFAHTHQGILDTLSCIPATPRHCVLLHSAAVKKIMKFVQSGTGLILVNKDRKDKEDRQNAKLDMIKILLRGHSIICFPESTWNLSPNKLHLPMYFGFLDIARKTGVPVVPVATEFTCDTATEREHVTNIHIRFGTPIYVDATDNLLQKLEEYSEAISTMKWELIAEKGLFQRKTLTNQEYINYLKGSIYNLQIGGVDLKVEREQIWSSGDEFYLFHHINDIPFNENGKLLDAPEVERLRLILNGKM